MREDRVTELQDPQQTSPGIGRRDLLRRGALLGGMVWAAPVVQSISSPAFAGTDDDTGGEGDPDVERHGVSFLALVFYDSKTDGLAHRAKFEDDAWAWVEPGNAKGAPECLPVKWDTAGIVEVEDDSSGDLEERFGLRVEKVRDEEWHLFVPDALDIEDSSGTLLIGVKSGNGEEGCGEAELDPEDTLGEGGRTVIILGRPKDDQDDQDDVEEELEPETLEEESSTFSDSELESLDHSDDPDELTSGESDTLESLTDDEAPAGS